MKLNILKYKLILFLLFIISGQALSQTSVIIDPMSNYTSIGNTTTLTFKINNVTNLHSYSITVRFNNSIVRFVSATKGSFLSGNDFFGYQPAASLVTDSVVVDQAKFGTTGVSGSGILFTIIFQGINNGFCRVYFSKIDLRDVNLNQISCTNMFGNIIVGALYANVNIFLQGPYNSSAGNMNTSLNSSGYLPNAQPYNQSPWNYNGTESVPSGFFTIQTNIVDWVLVELRQTPTGTAVSKRAALLKNDGRILDCVDGISNVVFTGVTSGNYYLVVRHRNHLAAMSTNFVQINSNPTLYNFSTGLSQFYGGDAKDFGNGVYGMYAGDVTSNGQIKYNGTGNDRLQILSLLSGNPLGLLNGYYNQDINLNGEVKYNGSNNDRLIILSNLNGNPLGMLNSNVP
jgi:hypothetical protein